MKSQMKEQLASSVRELEVLQTHPILKVHTAFEVLSKTDEWRVLIEEFYLKEEAVRSTHLLADPTMREDVDKAGVMAQLTGIAEFNAFISSINPRYDMLMQQIDTHENFINSYSE